MTAVGYPFLTFVVIVAFAAACTQPSGSPSPTPTPPTGTTSTSVTSPSPSQTEPLTTGPNVRSGEKPPRLGVDGMKHNAVGATLAGAFYFRALDWTIATNDDWLIRRLGLRSCGACNRVRRGLQALREKGQEEIGGRISVHSAVVSSDRYKIDYDFAIRVAYDEEAVRLKNRDGNIHTTQAAVRNQVDVVFLTWRSGTWRVVEVAQA
jgi:hypothetical protein